VTALVALTAFAGLPGQTVVERRTRPKDLQCAIERYATDNGVTVLLSPDSTTQQVFVDFSFAAGALYQPADKPGLAHLVEHLAATGDTPEVDYQGLLERRGALGFNAFTTLDRMSFRVAVPPEELPLALWVAADRLGCGLGRIDQAALERSKAIVTQEMLLRVDDVPYGATHVALLSRLFPPTHPLHYGVIGTSASVLKVQLADVQQFAARYLVAANGILTVTGNFDPKVAREWIAKTVAKLPPGERAAPPPAIGKLPPAANLLVTESVARRPRVTMGWRLENVLPETAAALRFGALLVSLYEGFLGMRVAAEFAEFQGGAVFILSVTMPGGAEPTEALNNAEVVFRFLTRSMMPADVLAAVAHALDRYYLKIQASPAALASFLADAETHPAGAGDVPVQEQQWTLTPVQVQEFSQNALSGPMLRIRSKPLRPLPRRPGQ
jgi:secreted Zn-dependent insulinase-like peptidase